MKLHERLVVLRKETGKNQKEFAGELGVEISKYNKWENGKTAPGYEDLGILADKLDVTTDYLLGRSDYKNQAHAKQIEDTQSEIADVLSKLSSAQRLKVIEILSQLLSGLIGSEKYFHDDLVMVVLDELSKAVTSIAFFCKDATDVAAYADGKELTPQEALRIVDEIQLERLTHNVDARVRLDSAFSSIEQMVATILLPYADKLPAISKLAKIRKELTAGYIQGGNKTWHGKNPGVHRARDILD